LKSVGGNTVGGMQTRPVFGFNGTSWDTHLNKTNKIKKNIVLRLFLLTGDPYHYLKTLMLSALRIELRNNNDGLKALI
jgi:hypothetical protein